MSSGSTGWGTGLGSGVCQEIGVREVDRRAVGGLAEPHGDGELGAGGHDAVELPGPVRVNEQGPRTGVVHDVRDLLGMQPRAQRQPDESADEGSVLDLEELRAVGRQEHDPVPVHQAVPAQGGPHPHGPVAEFSVRDGPAGVVDDGGQLGELLVAPAQHLGERDAGDLARGRDERHAGHAAHQSRDRMVTQTAAGSGPR
jgi:hypothetical protein